MSALLEEGKNLQESKEKFSLVNNKALMIYIDKTENSATMILKGDVEENLLKSILERIQQEFIVFNFILSGESIKLFCPKIIEKIINAIGNSQSIKVFKTNLFCFYHRSEDYFANVAFTKALKQNKSIEAICLEFTQVEGWVMGSSRGKQWEQNEDMFTLQIDLLLNMPQLRSIYLHGLAPALMKESSINAFKSLLETNLELTELHLSGCIVRRYKPNQKLMELIGKHPKLTLKITESPDSARSNNCVINSILNLDIQTALSLKNKITSLEFKAGIYSSFHFANIGELYFMNEHSFIETHSFPSQYGEKFVMACDHFSIESLREILTFILKLDLENVSLIGFVFNIPFKQEISNDLFRELMNALSKKSKLVSLSLVSLEMHSMNDFQFTQFTELLPGLHNLLHLDLSGNDWFSDNFTLFGYGGQAQKRCAVLLQTLNRCKKLKSLRLIRCKLGSSEKTFDIFCEFITSNQSLEQLDIRHSNFEKWDLKKYTKFIDALKINRSITNVTVCDERYEFSATVVNRLLKDIPDIMDRNQKAKQAQTSLLSVEENLLSEKLCGCEPPIQTSVLRMGPSIYRKRKPLSVTKELTNTESLYPSIFPTIFPDLSKNSDDLSVTDNSFTPMRNYLTSTTYSTNTTNVTGEVEKEPLLIKPVAEVMV